jgi:hypothetical protein
MRRAKREGMIRETDREERGDTERERDTQRQREKVRNRERERGRSVTSRALSYREAAPSGVASSCFTIISRECFNNCREGGGG